MSRGSHRGSALSAQSLAALIEGGYEAILHAYDRELDTLGGPIADDPVSRSQVMVHAEQILTDVVRSLQLGGIHVDDGYRLMSQESGVTRAARGVHPRESLQTASAFFKVALTWIVGHLDSDEESLRLGSFVALALHESMNLRVAEGLATYSGFLLSRIHDAQVDERRRIARELHDRIGHGITAAYRQLDLFDLHSTAEPIKASGWVETAQQAIDEATDSLAAITSELRLQERLSSLEKALQSLLDAVRTDGVSIRLRVNGDETWAPTTVRDESFLVVREAVRNALTHGRPALVHVRVDIAPHELRASVEDNGRGFDPAQSSGGFGLASMRERAALMGGAVRVFTEVDRGTHVELLVPLPGQREEAAT